MESYFFWAWPPQTQSARQYHANGDEVSSSTLKLVENLKVITPSPSVSLTLGENNTDSNKSDFELNSVKMPNQNIVNDASIYDVKKNKASWVNLFKDNRKLEENIMLKPFVNHLDEVVFGDLDEDNIEDTWGYGLVGYFVGRFPGKVALLQLCDSWKVNYKYYVQASG